MNLGNNLKEARKAAQMQQTELAERMGVTQKDVSRWERNERTPNAITLGRICKILGASADKVLELDKSDVAMTKELELEILMEDRCTKKEAERLLNNGTTVWAESEILKNLKMFFAEMCVEDEEEKEPYMEMLKGGKPVTDWSVVEYDGRKYYIMYVL